MRISPVDGSDRVSAKRYALALKAFVEGVEALRQFLIPRIALATFASHDDVEKLTALTVRTPEHGSHVTVFETYGETQPLFAENDAARCFRAWAPQSLSLASKGCLFGGQWVPSSAIESMLLSEKYVSKDQASLSWAVRSRRGWTTLTNISRRRDGLEEYVRQARTIASERTIQLVGRIVAVSWSPRTIKLELSNGKRRSIDFRAASEAKTKELSNEFVVATVRAKFTAEGKFASGRLVNMSRVPSTRAGEDWRARIPKASSGIWDNEWATDYLRDLRQSSGGDD